jgi:hypothetical protein
MEPFSKTPDFHGNSKENFQKILKKKSPENLSNYHPETLKIPHETPFKETKSHPGNKIR